MIFIGHFSPKNQLDPLAASGAGEKVQRQILDELVSAAVPGEVTCISMRPIPAWPNGPLLSSGVQEGCIEFPSYLNLPAIKHLIFGLKIYFALVKKSSARCVVYNAYFWENVFLFIYSRINPKTKIAIIIQDVHVGEAPIFSRRWIVSKISSISVRISGAFNLVVPISDAIASDFKIDRSKYFVFQGAATSSAEKLLKTPAAEVEDFAVFAGALERYNGVDLLVEQWVQKRIQHPLHVFGRGSLSPLVELAAKNSEYVIYHGFRSDDFVADYQKNARWNFCFRFSIGINQSYFFPSKLFNISLAPGLVVVNDFKSFPQEIMSLVIVVSDDLRDLARAIEKSVDFDLADSSRKRREVILRKYSWKTCVNELLKRLQ